MTTKHSSSTRLYSYVVLATTLLLVGASAQAGIITPAGLAVGAQFRLVFVSSGTIAATNPSISTYDTFVSTAATAAGLNTYGASQTLSWRDLGSAPIGASHNAIDRLNDLIPIYDLNGDLIAQSASAMWSNQALLHAIDFDENGDSLFGAQVWTGTNANGSHVSCADLGNGCFAPRIAEFGDSGESNSFWTASGTSPESTTHHLYGYSSVLTAEAASPEPGTGLLLVIGFGLGLVSLRVVASRQRRTQPTS